MVKMRGKAPFISFFPLRLGKRKPKEKSETKHLVFSIKTDTNNETGFLFLVKLYPFPAKIPKSERKLINAAMFLPVKITLPMNTLHRSGRVPFILLVLLALFFAGNSAQGQVENFPSTPVPILTPSLESSPTFQLEEVVVEGDKDKGDTWEGKDLETLNNDGRLSSFLDKAGGMETQGVGGSKTFSNASIRGSSAQQT